MKVNIATAHSVDDATCKAATGKTLQEWWAYLDERGGPSQGRREIGNHLYGELKVDEWWTATLNYEYETARGIKDKDGRHNGYTICVTKTINAPVEKVYAAWSDPALLKQWFADGIEAKVEDGGTWTDGDGNGGDYKRIRSNKDLRFTWKGASGDESLVDVTLTDKGGKTGLLINHARIQTTAEKDGLRAAWGEAANRLKSLAEG
ncbi:MAG: hypothetical protein HONBIEJF_01061 [Fimbriimonadaceae bacterium]|nr:hypothetical protein [Fimbriimonadaceae bacterium]